MTSHSMCDYMAFKGFNDAGVLEVKSALSSPVNRRS
jgi:hypothetical protein